MYSLYLHIPFCRHRCAYCDFNTYAGLSDLIPAYVQALCREIEFYKTDPPLPVHTIYFGGGTPSLLPLQSFEHLFRAIRSAFNLQPAAEISLEANPGTLTLDYLCGLRSLGFNRISLGMQSARPDELRLLERQHRVEDVIRAVLWARQAGFENLNLDLIFGLPSQVLADWQRSVALALDLRPQHLSLYALTVEEGTPLNAWVQRGLVAGPDPDLAADMYEFASERLPAAGFVQYEISNWARDDRPQPDLAGDVARDLNPHYACAHNLQYWRDLPYLGLGAGAHGYFGNLRVANILHPRAYIACLQNLPSSPLRPLQLERKLLPSAETALVVDRSAEMAEMMMMGLRLTLEGVSDAAFRRRFGQSLVDCYGPQIVRLIDLGLLAWAGESGDILRLTERGHLLGNQVFMEFIE